jgi:diguanylate cyclase (GGDEF)-like protein/PAS domain S-box-containing protein
MLDCLEHLFFNGLLMLQEHSSLWKPELVWLHVTSNSPIGLSYYFIFILLVYFVVRQRRDLPHAGIFTMLGPFTIISGTTDLTLIDVSTLWQPNYWLAGGIDSITTVMAVFAGLLSVLLLRKVLGQPRRTSPESADRPLTEEISDSVSDGRTGRASGARAINPRATSEKLAVATSEASTLASEADADATTEVGNPMDELEKSLSDRMEVLPPNNEPLKSQIDGSQRRSEEVYLLQSLTQAISEAPNFRSALGVALRRVCELTQWDYGEAWLPSSDNTVLECSPAWYGNTRTLELFRQTHETLTFAPNAGLPGRVWTSQQPEWIENISVQTDPYFVRPQVRAAELKAAFAVPILIDERVLAVLSFFMTQSRAEDRHLVELVAAVATQLGLVFQRKQLEEELRESEARYRAIVEDQTELICRFLSDGTLTFVNDAYCRYFGKTREELLGGSFFQMIPEEYRANTQRHIAKLRAKKAVVTKEYRIVKPNGDIQWQQWTYRAIAGQEERLNIQDSSHSPPSFPPPEEITREKIFPVVEFQSVGRDITDRRQSEQESARLASIALLSPNPIIETDLAGNVRYLNPEAMRLLPELQDSGAEHPFLAGVPSLSTVLQREGSLRREVKIGAVYYEQVLHYVEEIECLRIYAFDITERKQAEEQLIHNAFYDQLTGLANRALFMDRLRQAVRRAKQSHRGNSQTQPYLFAVLFLDLNRFKLVNDSLGNQIGDQLLQCFARRLQTCLRPTDTVARLGGDEFAILLEGIQGVNDATRVADAIHQTLNTPFYLDGCEVFMTLSIGIALNTVGNNSVSEVPPSALAKRDKPQEERVLQPEDLLRDADIAMYRAKAQGKSCYEVFDAAMHSHAVDRLQVETDLRRAIARQEFRVFYQPIVSLLTGRITGFEALIRWEHPQQGLVSPIEFIPIAEETGLITPIGWWTLWEACHQLKVWQDQFPHTKPLTMNVNLSCKQFSQPDLLQQIDKILEETQLANGSLKLEITESVVMDNPELVKDLLLELKKRNINLCIDDFGTGYSSLSRLHHFPISTLKIDRSFVSRIGALGENSEIVQAIVKLAQTLSMDVVAEGIELSEQVSPLIALQCEYGQGYFFSKPVDSKAAGELLAEEWRQRGMNPT